MNILLHVCCAPCAINPVEEAKREGHRITGFFYNPNIHPYSEYLRRKSEAERYSKEIALETVWPDYDLVDYFENVSYAEAQKNRCPSCWRLRLDKTARFAAGNGYEAFTTTLLGSPYQDHDIIKNICEEISGKAGIKFYYRDCRAGFKEAHQAARAKGIYCQNYCGCVFSEKERLEKKAKA